MRSKQNYKNVYVRGLLTLMIVLVLAILGGCENKKGVGELDPEHPTEIVVWNYYNGIQQKYFNKLIDDFNNTEGAKKGIIVKSISQGSINELTTSLQQSVDGEVGSQDLPDIFAAYSDTAYNLDQQGRLLDLEEYFTKKELSAYIDGYIKDGRMADGTLKMFPVAKSTEVLTLNKTDWDKFSEATGAKLEDLKTWEGIATVAEDYYNWSSGKAFFGRDSMANYIFIGAHQLGKDIYTVDAEGNVTYQLDEEIMRRLWDNYYVPYMSGYYVSKGKFRSDDAKTGVIIACVASTSSAYYFPSEVTPEDGATYSIDTAVYATPNFAGCDNVAVGQGAGMAVMKNGKKKEYASCCFLKWFTKKDNNTEFSLNSGYLPVKKESCKTEVLSKEGISTVTRQALETGLEMSENYEFYNTAAYSKATDARNIIEDSLQKKADNDHILMLEQMQKGKMHDEAIAEYDTDDNFQEWFQQLSEQLSVLK